MPKKPKKTLTPLAFNIRRLRAARGWSRQDLADHYGCDYSYIGQLENDLTTLGHNGRIRLSEVFGVDETELFRPKNMPSVKVAPVVLYRNARVFLSDEKNDKKYSDLIKEYRVVPVEAEEPLWIELCSEAKLAEPFNSGDNILIDRTRTVETGNLVIGYLGDKTFLGKYHQTDNNSFIMPLKDGEPPIFLSPLELANKSFRMAPVLGHFRPLVDFNEGSRSKSREQSEQSKDSKENRTTPPNPAT